MSLASASLSKALLAAVRVRCCCGMMLPDLLLPLQIVVALLEPLQEGGALTVAASKALEELIIKGRSLLQAKLKGLPPLPQSIQVVSALLASASRHGWHADRCQVCVARVCAHKMTCCNDTMQMSSTEFSSF